MSVYSDIFDVVLHAKMKNRQNVQILGPEGSGKSTMLSEFFNIDYRRDKVKDKLLISPVTPFPTTLHSDEVLMFFLNLIVNTLLELSDHGKNENLAALHAECAGLAENKNQTVEAKLLAVVQSIANEHYRMYLVIDNFEAFTFSTEVTPQHHETLLTTFENILNQIIITNYDLNRDSLPHGVRASLYLQQFAGGIVTFSGWPLGKATELINATLEGNSDGVHFSPELIAEIIRLSGGIYVIMKQLCIYAYDYICDNGDDTGIDFSEVYEDDLISTTMRHWCRMLTPEQIHGIRSENRDVLSLLNDRGLLMYKRKEKKYVFFEFFKKYCMEIGKLEAAAAENPLKSQSVAISADYKKSVCEQLDELCDAVGNKLEKKIDVLENEFNSLISLGVSPSAAVAKILDTRLTKLRNHRRRINEISNSILQISSATDANQVESCKSRIETELSGISHEIDTIDEV